jgi:hypothetical protein
MIATENQIARKLTEADRPLLDKEIAADPWHGQDPAFTSDLFYAKGTVGIFYEDDQGPVFILNGAPEPAVGGVGTDVRVRIQFCRVSLERIRACFNVQYPKYEARCIAGGIKGITFDSKSKGLILFFKRLGFREYKPENFRKDLVGNHELA